MRTIAEQFKYWQEALDDFQKNVEKDLDEIRRYKSEVQQMKIDLIDHLEKGRYVRDDQRVIISAPEIIIGNVDKSGTLCGSNSRIILRGTNISLDGVGAGASGVGSIVSRAASIRQIAVDPGMDGQENVAKGISEIVSQARNVIIRSEKQANDVFPTYGLSGTDGGITLSTDGQISLNATLPCETLKERLEQEETALTTQTNDLKKEASQAKSEVSSLISQIDKLFDQDLMNLDETMTRTNYMDIEELHEEIRNISGTIYTSMTRYFNVLSRLAEANRQLNSIKEQKEAAGQREKYRYLHLAPLRKHQPHLDRRRRQPANQRRRGHRPGRQGNQPYLLRQRRCPDQGQQHLYGLAGRGNQYRQPQDSGQEHRPAG